MVWKMAQQPSLELPQTERARIERNHGAVGRARRGPQEGIGSRFLLEKVSRLPTRIQSHVYASPRKGRLETGLKDESSCWKRRSWKVGAKHLGWEKFPYMQCLCNACGSMSQAQEENEDKVSEKVISPFKATQSLWWDILV